MDVMIHAKLHKPEMSLSTAFQFGNLAMNTSLIWIGRSSGHTRTGRNISML